MALPGIIQRLFSFTAFQQSQGDNAFPGTNIDADLDQTNNAVNALSAGLVKLLRPDGKLANGIVGRNALAADVLLGVGPSKPWSAGQAYVANTDTVTRANKVYLSVVASVGVDPLLDVTGAYWLQTADISQAVVVADGSIGTSAFADKGVTEPKLGDGAASNRVYAAKSITRDKTDDKLGLVPIGAIQDYAGWSPPPGWVFCAGQPVSRTAFADLFAALTVPFTGSGAASSLTISTGVSNFAGIGLRGATIEGPGISNGTIVTAVANGFLTISNPLTQASTGAAFRVFPYGRGDGSTTFNVPDARGRTTFARDDMGGLGAGRFVAPFDGANLSGVGGATQATLVGPNLPSAMPGGAVTISYPPHNYVTQSELTTVSAGAGGTAVNGIWRGLANATTGAPNNQTFGVANTNPGGDQPFSLVPPCFITNKIIFLGA